MQKKQNAKPTKSILIKRLSGFIGGVNNEVTNITSAHTSTCHFCLRDVFDFYLARCCSALMHFPFFLARDPCVSRDTCTLTIYLLIQSRSYFFSVSSKSAFMQLQILIHKLYCKSDAKPLEKYQNWLKYVNFHCFEGKRRTPISSTVQLYTSDVRQDLRKHQQFKNEKQNQISEKEEMRWATWWCFWWVLYE